MSSKFLGLAGLKECIGTGNAFEAKDILETVSKFFDEQLSKAELEFALETIFNTETGTIAFLNRSIKENKKFSDCNVSIFLIWIKILREQADPTKFGQYVEDIIQCSTRFVISTQVSAKEKEKATIVLQEVFQNKLADDIDASELVTKLIDVFNAAKQPGIFSQQVFILLGIIARDTPENISERNEALIRNTMIRILENTLLNEETVQFTVLAGAMEGLNLYLMNFAPSPSDDASICDSIYVCVKKLSDPTDYVKAKAPFRCALDLFSRHYLLFAQQIYRDFKFWQECLTSSNWLNATVYDDRRKGIIAIQAFHKAIEHEFDRKQLSDADKNILLFLMQNFRSTLESAESKSYQNRIAIRGFGLMAKTCKQLLPDMLKDVLSLVIQRTELISLAEDNELRDSLEHFPDYVEALSQIIKQVGPDDENMTHILANSIQSILIRLIRDYHYLSKAHTNLASNAICRALFNLSEMNGSLFDSILDKIIMQGIIWTCSHKLVYDANLDWDTGIDWKENITYKFYIDLWQSLLEDTAHSDFDKPFVSNQIFNCMIANLLTILEKLNLKTKRRVFVGEGGEDQEFYFCDPNIDLCPENPKDFHIFFNLVDFYREIFFSKFNRQFFRKWINEFCTKLVDFTIENPLVSGFLKLLECGLTIADHLNHFQSENEDENETLFTALSYLFKTVIIRCQKVSGELQLACLELVMKFPQQFYKDNLIDLIPVFGIALDLGKSIMWLAKISITSLEKICGRFENDAMAAVNLKKFLESVMPKLDCYLQGKGFEEQHISAEIVTYKNKKRVKRSTFAQRIESTELFEVQKRIFNFLGKLEPQQATLLLDKNASSEDLVKWHVEQNVKLNLYCNDVRLEIYLDTIIPRICYLACTSVDRKTKIAACELVHALVLYLLGAKIHKGTIWEVMCSKVLILGADNDSTIQQMFEPLLRQMMHYMSKYENLDKGVDILMKVLMDGISNKNNCAVQDLSAICIREFVEWSIKQTTPQQLAASPVSIEMILNQLKIYSFDSSLSRRVGSALAFNNLYRKLREEESICDVFFIDLLYSFCVNFKLSEELSTVPLGSINSDLEQVSLSLDHVVRVLRQRNYLFKKPNPKRIVPTLIGPRNRVVLQDVVISLLKECQNKLMNYRQKCLSMVGTLSTAIENVTSVPMFFTKFISIDILEIVCEGPVDGLGIRGRPTLSSFQNLSTENSFAIIHNWMQNLLSSLDCYIWLLNNNALKEPKKIFLNAKIFEAIGYYFKEVCWKTMFEIIEGMNCDAMSIDSADTVRNLQIEEIHRINAIQCFIKGQIINFLNAIFNSGCATEIPASFWTDWHGNSIINFICNILYEPTALGFELKYKKITRNYLEKTAGLIKSIQQHCLNQSFYSRLIEQIAMNLTNHMKDLTNKAEEFLYSEQISEFKWNMVKGILFVLKSVDLVNVVDADNLIANGRLLMTHLFDGIIEMIFSKETTITPAPDVKKFANQLLKISFALGEVVGLAGRELILTTFIGCLLNERSLLMRGTLKSIKHGEHFYSVYKQSIFEHCTESFIDVIIPILFSHLCKTNAYFILKVVIEIVEYSYKHKQYDQGLLKSMVDVNLKYFPKVTEILSNYEELPLVVEYINSLALACPITWKMWSYKTKQPQIEVYVVEKLKDRAISLEQKSKLFILLPLIVGVDDFEHKQLTDALHSVQSHHFPLRSSEFRKNSTEETALKVAFKSLLDALVSSKSFVILEFILHATAADKKHIVEYIIREDLIIYINELNSSQQLLILQKIFEKCNNETFETQIRLTIFERFLLPSINNSCDDCKIEFYVRSFGKVSTLIDSKYGFAKQGWSVEHALVNRIIGFSLIEVFFGSLPKEKYYYADCPIISAFLPNEKMPNVLVGTVSRKSFYARTDVFVTDDARAKDLFRQYQCAAYKALCAITCNTQTDMKYYLKFLFEESAQKNEFIWMKLIDCNDGKLYIHDSQEMETYTRTKERFVSIRRLNPGGSAYPLSQIGRVTSSRYLQTQNVFCSSLSQDVSRIDMNYSMVRGDAEAVARKEQLANQVFSVKLERTELNKHEIMPTLCGVIQHMHENGITSLVSDPVRNKVSLPWIVCVANAIDNFSNHKNVRIFLAQVVDNCRNVFEPFAHILFKPILQLLFDECAGQKLNFFITDMIALLLTWTKMDLHTPTSIEEIRLSSSLLQFLMKNAWNENKHIFKYNLELIQTMISLWKNQVDMPHRFLLDIIQISDDLSSKANEPGLIMNGIVLANGLTPWIQRTKVNFIKTVFSNLNNTYTSVYQPAAYVYGMILGILKEEQDSENLEQAQVEMIEKLKALANKHDTKKERYFKDILYGVHKNYPEILDAFKETISFKIPSAIGAIKKLYMEMILTRLEEYSPDEIYNIIISIGIKDLLKNDEFQLLALHILNKSLQKLEVNEIKVLMPIVETCAESVKAECRDVTYEILIYIAQISDDVVEADSPKADMKKKADLLLLKGLLDTDTDIQKRIFHYWSQETNLSQNISERILSLVSKYSLNSEQQFLGFCTQLILEPAIQNIESKQQIFQFETDRESKLQEYEINTNSRIRSTTSLPPLFADSQSKSMSTMNYNFIRATPGEYFFEPTKNPMELSQMRTQFTLPTQSSLPFSIKPHVLNRRSQKVSGLDTVEVSNLEAKQYDTSLRRRFLKDKEVESRETALRVIDQKSRKKSTGHWNNREAKVILYRRYRIGEYPDLLINSLAFLLPLQGIVKRDRYIARQIFVSIFGAMIKFLGPNSNQFITSIGNKIQNIFNESKSCDPVVFSTFLEIALLKADSFNLRPETVSMIARACNMQTIGVVYLETRINNDFDESESGPSTKSGSVVTNCERHWLELSDIYNSLAEYDIVAAIFSDKIDADPRLAEAIELKTSGRYKEAQDLLLKVIERRKLIEQNFSYNCFYECFEELGDWSMLSTAVQQQIEDFEELWTDEYNTNYFLPKLIKAELQLILKAQPYSTEFIEILQNWMKSDHLKADYIKQTFCEELMMLQIANENYRQARVHCEDHLKKFLLDWGIMSTHYDKLRQENLLNTQKVAEIDYYALLLLEQFDEKVISVLTHKWDNCKIDKSDSLRYWNCLLSYRTYIAGLFIANLENSHSEDTSCKVLQKSINNLVLQLFDAAVYQKNVGIVGQLIKDLKVLKDLKQNDLQLEYEVAQIKSKLLQAEHSSKTHSVSLLEQTCQQIGKTLSDNDTRGKPELQVEIFQLKSKALEEVFKKLPSMSQLTPKIMETFLEYANHSRSDEDFQTKIFKESLWALKRSTEIAENLDNSNTNNYDLRADAYNRLAEFCYEYNQSSEPSMSVELEKHFISSVFSGMRYNSSNCRQLFSCILQMPSLANGSLTPLFVEESKSVPDWMFLDAIPEIMARLDFQNESFVDELVLRLATSYPNALVFQFSTWLDKEKSFLENKSAARLTIKTILNYLNNPLFEKFIRALKSLRFPHYQLENGIIKLLADFPKKQSDYLDSLQSFINIFNLDEEFNGSIYRNISLFKPTFEKLKTRDCVKDESRIREVLNVLRNKITDAMKQTEKYLPLKSFCPWLANFHWCGEDTYIELPGQYDGSRKPTMEKNIKIVKFDEKVEVFQSLRKPLRIKIFGSDGKSHDFIVKFGEDLQQDQRVQQVLRIMSQKLQSDRQCSIHNLYIKTYKVIPLEQNGGLISFIYDTKTIQDLITNCFSRREPDAEKLMYKALADYVKFIKEPVKQNEKTKDVEAFGVAVTTYSRDQIIANFRNIQSNITLDVIKYALVDMAVSPESFYTLRNNYAKTLAAISVSHWVLGIGDRHLQNILISTKDGSLAGIDFGVILGGGIRNLIIPEIIPFRLTPQFINVLNPMGTSGILFKCMSHSLRVYRNSSQSLLASIEMFAATPTQDWIALQNTFKLDWKPRDGIKIVKQKLEGGNPMLLMMKDLEESAIAKYRPAYKEGYERILKGNYQFNIRARLPEGHLSVEDQIKCLLDLATDPAILGCSYYGLNAWL